MSIPNHKKIPVNIIAGSLGAGKTTTINHLLTQRPKDERWAILVNEYGLVGIDAALIHKEDATENSGVDIKEVAGGCICCSAGFMFEVSLVRMLQRHPDRLLIEPTGLAALSGILDTLARPGICESVDIRSVICILDPARYEELILRKEIQDQVEAADIILANRSDLATSEQLASFLTWGNHLFPPKRSIKKIIHGDIPLQLLDLVVDRVSPISGHGHQHGTDHHHQHGTDHHHESIGHEDTRKEFDTEIYCESNNPIIHRIHRSEVASTLGWICWDGLVFDAERIFCWISGLAKIAGTLRVKAVFRTNEGWWGFNFVNEIEEVQPSGHRRDSRVEIIIEGGRFPDPETLEASLKKCLVST